MKVTREEIQEAIDEFIGDESEWVDETNFMNISDGFWGGVQWILCKIKLNELEETTSTMS